MSDYLQNARDFLIGDYGNFSTVNGIQNNYYNQTTTCESVSRRKRFEAESEEEARYAEYHDVRCGDIVIKRDLCTSRVRWWFDEEKQEWVQFEGERFFTAEVRSEAGKASSTYTVVSYHGPEKEEAWKKDFDQLSGDLSSTNVQVFGYNRSKPLLLLHNDLVPLAHLLNSVGVLGQVYLGLLSHQSGSCLENELWMDSSRGVLCRGPRGPHCTVPYVRSHIPNGLFNAELLQEDILIRYLAALKLNRDVDRVVVNTIASQYSYTITSMRVDQPSVISSLTNTAIAIAVAGTGPSSVSGDHCLGEREVLSNRLTRFTLKHCGLALQHLRLDWDWVLAECSWITQSLMVFHTHGIRLESDLSQYGESPHSLFLLPFAHLLQTSFARFRLKVPSHDQEPSGEDARNDDGHLPIPDCLCKYLGLPIKLEIKYEEYSFLIQVYQTMRNYQILRGFDPTTSNFARHCGYNDYKFEPVRPSLTIPTTSGRFEELDNSASVGVELEDGIMEDLESVYTSLPILFGDLPVEDDTSMDTPESAGSSRAMASVWSRLTSSFSWTASGDSEIHAMAF